MGNMITENVSSAGNHAGKTQISKAFDLKKKAYLFGVYLGDGCCSKFGRHHLFTILSEDRDVIEKTMIIVNEMLQTNYRIKSMTLNIKELYRLRSWNKKMFEILRSETDNKSKIPEFVISSDANIASEFIAGLMDTDGYISRGINKFNKQRFSLGFINSAKWLDTFITLLRSLGVKVGKKTFKKKYRSMKEKDCYQININLRSFVEAGLYFTCRRKQQILESYKTNVRYQAY